MPAPSWLTQVRSLTDDFFNLIFPPVCVSCRKVGEILCQSCQTTIPWIDGPICPACGRVLQETAELCGVCAERPLPLQQIRAAVTFESLIPHAIHQMKYEGFFALARPLANLMIVSWPRWQTEIDLVLPIPLHPRRQKKRGYNQSELLAKQFCQGVNLPYNNHALRRVRSTPPQVGLNAAERRVNMQNAFSVNNLDPAGQHLLLVDDVCTTGSTLAAAAEALLAADAATVSAYCVARAT